MTLKNTFAIATAFLLLIAVDALAVDQSAVETQLRQLLQNKIIALRVPYVAADLKYDVSGQLIGTSEIGPWTLYNSIQISDLSLKDTSFQLDGERIILVLPNGKTTVTPMLTGRKVHLTLALTPPIDQNSVLGALGNVFTGSSVDEHFASYWKPSVDQVMSMEKPCKTVLKANSDGIVGTLASSVPVYACVKGNVVSKPKGISTPAPGSDTKKPLDGSASLRIVIDENGYPAIIYPKSSSNVNYGIAAIMAVSQWKYSPAIKDGRPVAYMLDVDLGKSAAAMAADSDKD